MKKETISIHGGYTTDPTTKSVAVPIYQTVSYEFDKFNNTCVMPLLSGNLALKWNDVIIFFNEKSMQEISSD